jgi:hypothetical protein
MLEVVNYNNSSVIMNRGIDNYWDGDGNVVNQYP